MLRLPVATGKRGLPNRMACSDSYNERVQAPYYSCNVNQNNPSLVYSKVYLSACIAQEALGRSTERQLAPQAKSSSAVSGLTWRSGWLTFLCPSLDGGA